MASTQHEDYRADQGWEGVNEREMFARQEYEKYEQQRHAEIQRQINMGMVSRPPGRPSGQTGRLQTARFLRVEVVWCPSGCRK